MIDRRLALIVLPAGALSVYLVSSFLTSSEVEFTRAAPPAPETVELRPAVSTAFLDLPIDLSSVVRRTQSALDQRLASAGEASAAPVDPACARRPASAECSTARNETQIGQNGAISMETLGSTIKLRIPVRIEPTVNVATPPASRATPTTDKDIGDRSSLDAVLAFNFTARPSSAGGFELIRRDDAQPEGLPTGVTGAQMRILRQVESRLRPVALAAHDELRQIFNTLPVATATQTAWTALSQSFELGKGSGVWLRPIPELVGSGQLVSTGNRAAFRIPIAARLSIDEGGRGAVAPRRPVIQGQILTQTGASIRIATGLPLDQFQTFADTALIKSGPISIRPDRFGPPVQVVVRRIKAYPSVRQIGFALDVTASRYEGQSFKGRAHLVARPQLDADMRTVELADVTLTTPPTRETGAGKVPANAPRLGSEPIAGMLASAARLDISREVGEAVPRYSGLLHQRLGDRLAMSAHIDEAVAVGVETSSTGLWLLADLNGALILTYEGASEAPQPSSETVSAVDSSRMPSAKRITSPESAAAAVVSATATAGVLHATKGNSSTSIAQPSASSAGSAVAIKLPAPAVAAEAEAEQPKPKAAATVKTRVLSTGSRTAAQGAKVATKQSWVPFPQ